MDNEKKIKLEELPDSGSEPETVALLPKKIKTSPEPRLENLKMLTDSEKVEALAQLWHFDQKKPRWTWLFILLALFALEKSKVLSDFHAKKIKVEKPSDRIGSIVFDNPEVEFLMKHPLVFALLIPVFFKLRRSPDDYFEITFQGIHAVKTLDVPPFHKHLRVKMKWDEINQVKKVIVKGREVIELSNINGPEAQLIWDIDEIKKRVVKQVLMNLVSNKHPMRIFIEKEVA
jgi:hypothetical protein